MRSFKNIIVLLLLSIQFPSFGQNNMLLDDMLVDRDISSYINNLRKYIGMSEFPFDIESYKIADYLNKNRLYIR